MGFADGTNNGVAIGRKGGTTLDGKDQKNSLRLLRNKVLEPNRGNEPADPINMGSVTGGYSDPGVLGS
jgi:hypothetical protein